MRIWINVNNHDERSRDIIVQNVHSKMKQNRLVSNYNVGTIAKDINGKTWVVAAIKWEDGNEIIRTEAHKYDTSRVRGNKYRDSQEIYCIYNGKIYESCFTSIKNAQISYDALQQLYPEKKECYEIHEEMLYFIPQSVEVIELQNKYKIHKQELEEIKAKLDKLKSGKNKV